MVLDLRGYRVFIACPGGLDAERARFRDTLHAYSEDEAIARSVLFIPAGWEETLGGYGRPQELINADIRSCDFFVLLLWDRWGSPPARDGESEYSSGTEEEIHVALEALGDKDLPMRDIVALFKGVEERQLSDPGAQLQKVLDFRRSVENSKTLLYHTFDTVDEFSRLLRRHLSLWVRQDEEKKATDDLAKVKTSEPQPGLPPSDGRDQSVETLLDMAESLAAKGSIADAEALFAQAVVGRRDLDAINRYGRFLRRVNRRAHAKAMFRRVLELTNRQDDPEAVAVALSNLGVLFRKEGRTDNALEMYEESISLAQTLGDHGLALQAYNFDNIGQMRRASGDLPGAREMHLKSLQIHKKLGDSEKLAHTYGNLGVVLRRLGELDEALDAHRDGIKNAEELGELGLRPLTYNYGNLGLVLIELERCEEALPYLDRALETNRQLQRVDGMAVNLAHKAWALLGIGNPDEAEVANSESFEFNSRLGNFEGMANNLRVTGLIASGRGELAAARDAFYEALDLNETIRRYEGTAECLDQLGDLCLAEGKNEEACSSWVDALSALEHVAVARGKEGIKAKIEANC